MGVQNRIFKFKATKGDPAFFNTVSVFVTYTFVIIFFVKQMITISATTGTDTTAAMTFGTYLDKFVDAIGVTTFTYVFTAALQTQAFSNGMFSFGTDIWIVVLITIYIALFGWFIPRPWGLNIALCIFTILIVLKLSWSITAAYRSPENGQATDHSMERKEKGEDGLLY